MWAAAAAKSLRSCQTLCDPRDGSFLSTSAGDLRELPRVSLRVEGYCGVGGASRGSAAFVAMEEGLISRGSSQPRDLSW